MRTLTLADLKSQVAAFAAEIEERPIPEFYGVTDGKAVGTYVELLFNQHLQQRFTYPSGNAATGVDFPSVGVDLKVTSIRQPQSSCPFRSAEQKVYGLGYHLLILVYDKRDERDTATAHLHIVHAIFVDEQRTADYQTTRGLLAILDHGGNRDDLVAFLEERNLPLDDIGRGILAERILEDPPVQGVLTISNALQWRLQYGRVIALGQDGHVGVEKLV